MGDTVRAAARRLHGARDRRRSRRGAPGRLRAVRAQGRRAAARGAGHERRLHASRSRASGTGRYRLQVQRDSAIEAVSSPIYLEPPLGAVSATGRSNAAARAAGARASRPATQPNATHAAAARRAVVRAAAAGFLTADARRAIGRGARLGSLRRRGRRSGDARRTRPTCAILAFVTDVRDAGDGSDYAGELVAVHRRADHRPRQRPRTGTSPAPSTDSELAFPFALLAHARTPCGAPRCSVTHERRHAGAGLRARGRPRRDLGLLADGRGRRAGRRR